MQETNYGDSISSRNDKINLREVLKKYSYHWKLFLLCIIISLTASFFYLRFATYEYEVSSTILINDEDNDGGLTSEISAFEDLGLFTGPKTSLDTEVGILKSISLLEKVIEELRLNITYYTKNGIAVKEVYNDDIPFNIHFFVNDSILNRLNTQFSISPISTTQYLLYDSNGDQIGEGYFGKRISGEFSDLIITPNDINNVGIGQNLLIKISPLEEVAIALKKRIEITPDNVKSNLLILTLQDAIRLKAKNILNSLVLNYNNDAVEYKREIAKVTDEFISNRIDDISVQLTSSDQGVESYKTRNRLSNLDSESSLTLSSNVAVRNQIGELNSQIKLIDYVNEYMKTNKGGLIPSNLGMLNEKTGQNTLNYNNLVLERNRLLAGANEENPLVANLNNQITELRESIDQGLRNSRSSLVISLNEARLQEGKINNAISSAPKRERDIKDIQRQQEIYETLYLYLLQKREENSISLASTASNAKIIDRAYGSNIPVSPRKVIVLLASLLLGFLLPALFLAIRSLLDNKIHTQEDIQDLVKAPIIGDIPTAISKKKVIDFEHETSNIAESFRLLRTNINYMLSGDLNGGKNIFITSTIEGEGKTFIAINLARSLALLNKKVLLIEADIRKPRIATYLNLKQPKGLCHFLVNHSSQMTDLITHSERTNFDILIAGDVPPNPAELLANSRFDKVIAYGKENYDLIIIDTAPVNAATDTLLLAHHADLLVYVIRADFLNKRMLKIPKGMFENKRLPNMSMLLNGTNYKKSGYDRAYGYGQEGLNKSWWKRLLK
jgi:capsular exopolysaccharide synthesis family protein